MKSLFVSICGAPNSGKSTLVNYLVGQKISIVSPKVQTTRDVIRGILTENDTQIVFLDTPGIFKPKKNLEKMIVRNAHEGIRNGQLICMVIDGIAGIEKNASFIIYELIQKNKPFIVALNKIDTMKPNKIIESLAKNFDPKSMLEIFPISANTGQGIGKLKQYFIDNALEDVWYYDQNDVTDRDLKFSISEILREKLFIELQEELPYNLYVTTDKIIDEDSFYSVFQTIYITKQSQKNIIIGKKGLMISTVVNQASFEIGKLLEKPAKLSVFVKVKEDWLSRIY